jgi:hypothetical protein
MKPIAAAVVGAILAAGMMYIVMRPDRPAEPPVQPAANAQPAPTAPAAETPLTSAPSGETPAVHPPARVAPEPEPYRASNRRTPPREQRSTRTVQEPKTPAQSAPTVTQSTTPQTPTTPTPAPSQQGSATSDLVWTPPPPPANTETKTPVIEEKKPERVAQTVTIPAGTLVSVRVDETLSTASKQTGDSFRATLDQPIVIDGFVIAERGARVEGRIVESDPGGRVQGLARLSLELVRLNSADGQRLKLQTEPFAKQAQNEKKRDAAKVGAAAGIGAAIGAIAGGGKGAAIGAIAGGAAGAGGVAATRGAAAEVPAETRMTFRLRDAITVTEKLK